MNPSVAYLLALVRAAILNIDPPPMGEDVDPDTVRRLSSFSHLDIPAYYSMRRIGIPSTDEEDGAFVGNVVKDTEQKEALRELVSHLTAVGIQVMPLKGCLLKPLYPTGEMRYMGDIDLYYRGSDESLLQVMRELGYTAKLWKRHRIHHVFQKPETLCVELHHHLSLPENPFAEEMNESVWSRATEDPANPGLYRMSFEDEYLFLLLHALKHFYSSGFGIRNYYDFWLFHRAHPEVAESERVRGVLSEAGLLRFAERIRHLSEVLMSDQPLSAEDGEMIAFCFRDGLYGTQIGLVSRKMSGERPSKLAYLMRRVFPSVRDLSERYPILSRGGALVLLYPWYWLRRFFSILFFSRDRIRRDLSATATICSEDLDVFRIQRAYLGLSDSLRVVDEDEEGSDAS